jgi:predicted Fe-Mo cluster-binding NifX family protein
MKICITSTGPSLDSEVDPRFGRCRYFIFADSEGLAFEPVENPNIGASGGAGIQSAQLVANKGANLLITGQVGPNAYTTLQAAGIKIVTSVTGRVEDVLERWKKGDFSTFTQGPTVQAHAGMRGGGLGRGMGRGMQSRASAPSSPASGESVATEIAQLREQAKELRGKLDQITQKIETLEKAKK